MNSKLKTSSGPTNRNHQAHTLFRPGKLSLLALLFVSLGLTGAVQAQTKPATVIKGVTQTPTAPAAPASTDFASVGPTLELVIGKSTLLRIPSAIERISVGNPSIADVSLISPTELYLLATIRWWT